MATRDEVIAAAHKFAEAEVGLAQTMERNTDVTARRQAMAQAGAALMLFGDLLWQYGHDQRIEGATYAHHYID